MCISWPHTIPDYLRSDHRRSAEIKVFDKIAELFSDEWTNFYSSPWWGIDRRGNEREGEADFIIAHPDLGILFLEVKGGAVAYSPETRKWKSTDRLGIEHTIKDPVSQATRCKHQYLNQLKQNPNWPKQRIRFRHGVVLPDSKRPSSDIQSIAGYAIDLFAFADNFNSEFENWVRNRLKDYSSVQSETGPGIQGITLLEKRIAAPVRLQAAPRVEIDYEIQQMERILTGAQFQILEELLETRRAVVEGGAGTGKTVLASELAVRLSQQDQQLLFLCRSKALASRIKLQLGSPSVEVLTLGDFLNRFSSPAWNSLQHRQYDSIIVDEAQDVNQSWWEKIECQLANSGRLYAFFDSNQAVYQLPNDLGARLGAETRILNVNLRNTRKICKATEKLYQGPLIRPSGPIGEFPTRISVDSLEQQFKTAAELVARLINEKTYPVNHMVCLVDDDEGVLNLRQQLENFKIESRRADETSVSSIVIESVARFKGLESPVVILVATDKLARNAESCYVGVSRARSRLYVIETRQKSLLSQSLDLAECEE